MIKKNTFVKTVIYRLSDRKILAVRHCYLAVSLTTAAANELLTLRQWQSE